MDDVSSLIAYHHIYPWLHGNAVHISLDFNFNDVPQNDFETRLDNMLDVFEHGHLQEYVNFRCSRYLSDTHTLFLWSWAQFMVIITTHSDPASGYLHIAPDNAGSVPVQEV